APLPTKPIHAASRHALSVFHCFPSALHSEWDQAVRAGHVAYLFACRGTLQLLLEPKRPKHALDTLEKCLSLFQHCADTSGIC
ncbi:hypothetical protein KIPB_016162, partial [Kipferlia bialata]